MTCTVCGRPARLHVIASPYVFDACGYHERNARGWGRDLSEHGLFRVEVYQVERVAL